MTNIMFPVTSHGRRTLSSDNAFPIRTNELAFLSDSRSSWSTPRAAPSISSTSRFCDFPIRMNELARRCRWIGSCFEPRNPRYLELSTASGSRRSRSLTSGAERVTVAQKTTHAIVQKMRVADIVSPLISPPFVLADYFLLTAARWPCILSTCYETEVSVFIQGSRYA